MKPTIQLKTIGYICLKTGIGFIHLADFLSYKAKEANKKVVKLFKLVKFEEQIKKAKDRLTTPFKRFCAKVKAKKAYFSWLA